MLTLPLLRFYFFFFNDTATTEIYTLSLHDALPISLHVVLFLTTLLTTTFAGAVLSGAIAYDNPLDLFTGTYPLPAHLARAMATGLAFSLPLLAILLCHELGHYLTEIGRAHV